MHNGGPAKEFGKCIGIHCRGGDNEVQISPSRQNGPQQPKENIRIQRTLVRLVDNNDAVVIEVGGGEGFAEKDTVGHKFDCGKGRGAFLKADCVTNGSPQLNANFLRDASCDRCCGNTTRLGNDNALAGADEMTGVVIDDGVI